MELVYSKMEDWEQKRLKENVFKRLKRKRILSFLLTLFIFIPLFSLLIKWNTLPFIFDKTSLYYNWMLPFLLFVGFKIVVKHLRMRMDVYYGTKKTIHSEIIQVFSFFTYKIVLIKKMRVLVLNSIQPYFLSVKKGQKIILKISKTDQLIDLNVIDENEIIKGETKLLDYSDILVNKRELEEKGFLTLPNVYSIQEIQSILNCMKEQEFKIAPSIKKSSLILYKSFFKKNLEVKKLVMNSNLQSIVHQLFGDDYFVVNSMYFDKPGRSAWGVAYHQDRQIIVREKKDVEGFNEWFNEFDLLTVRATNEILQHIFTIRIHIDETNKENGSLQVIESSHKHGIFDPSLIDKSKEVNCDVSVGGVMIMSPLVMHQSLSSSSDTKRRVIHFDITNVSLPGGLQWGEKEGLLVSRN
jgi:hypothetical protein